MLELSTNNDWLCYITIQIQQHTMKNLILIATLFMLQSFTAPGKESIHQFKIKSIDGGVIDFSKFKGKKILVVNTASECGYTPQYEALQKLADTYKNKLVVVGFPANNFGGQEPGSDAEIKQFCKARFGVTFPLASKISVTGTDAAPIYKWLTQKKENGVLDATIKWNFNKFLLDENGEMIAYFPSSTKPDSPEITGQLK
jgi:glutathione peroxidase